jgi:hypothetical protein
MVLLESAITELSSLTASVTLWKLYQYKRQNLMFYKNVHQRIWLLLLLEDSRCRVIGLDEMLVLMLPPCNGGVANLPPWIRLQRHR